VSRFPPEAFDQAAAMFDASLKGTRVHRDRRLRVRGFLLWWDAKPVAGNPRELILKTAEPMFGAIDRIRAEERTVVVDDSPADETSDEADDLAFDIADAYVEKHAREPIRGPVFRRVLRNLGRRREDFLSVIVALLTTALGGHPILEDPSVKGDSSVGSLILKSFAAHEFPKVQQPQSEAQAGAAPQESGSDEDQVRDILQSAAILSNRDRVRVFTAGLDDYDLTAARKYARVFLEDIPIIFEAHEIVFGKNKFTSTIRTLSRAPTELKAYLVIGVAWLVQRFGPERFESIAESCKRARPQAEVTCTLAKAFPSYRELFLERNLSRLAALPEETRQKMFESIKSLITQ